MRGDHTEKSAFIPPMQAHNRFLAALVFFLAMTLLTLACLGGCRGKPPAAEGDITARMLVAPDALMGPGPSSLSWSYYDTIYTERYMGTPAQNPEGYASTDLIAEAGEIGAEPLIIHGLADTNVHLQNTVNFIQALEHADKPFLFIPLPNEDHHYEGDGLVTVLSASADYFAQHLGNR